MFKETRFSAHNVPQMLKELVQAELRIIQARGVRLYSKPAIVRVNKISVNGLSFLSPLTFPVMPEIRYRLQLKIINETIELVGAINRCQLKDDDHSYEMSYKLDVLTKSVLHEQLNELSRLSMPLHLKADYYYQYFSEPEERFQANRINFTL